VTPAAIAAIEAEASRVYGINLVHVPQQAQSPTAPTPATSVPAAKKSGHWPLPRTRSTTKSNWVETLKAEALALAKIRPFTSRDLINVQPVYNKRNEVLRVLVIEGLLVTARAKHPEGEHGRGAEIVYRLPLPVVDQ
jgi:hypothetical protein